jgi:hypothetical protein
MRRTALVALFVFALSAIPVSGLWAQCDPLGAGDARPTDAAKVALNTLKNRVQPPPAVTPMTVDQILDFDDSEDTNLENTGVVLEGWLLGARHEGPESPNCHSQTRRDFHMWMGESPNRPRTAKQALAMRRDAVVVEPTPNMQEQHPSWTDEGIRSLVRQRIRVTGWLMYDPEHPDQLDRTRGTLWEVHPVMRIEVLQSDGTWQEF